MSRLLSLPPEVCDRIWEETLCTQGAAQLIYPDMRGEKFNDNLKLPRYRFPQKVQPNYPPSNREVAVQNAEDADDSDVDDEESGEEEEEEEEDVPDTQSDFLRVWADEDSDNSDPNTDVDTEDEEGPSDMFARKRHPHSRYRLETLHPFNLALLRVNRQIHDEALPIFYGRTHFIIDCDPRAAKRFFRTLPGRARRSIETIAITSEPLSADDGDSREYWSKSAEPSFEGPPQLRTPFGAFLAKSMPKLRDVYLYSPYGGIEDWHLPFASLELEQLLGHGSIEALYYCFFGKSTAYHLRKGHSSERCYRGMMGVVLDPRVENRIFDSTYEPPKPREDIEGYVTWRKWKDDQELYGKPHGKVFQWCWSDRDLDMGSDGNVQAVIKTWV